MDLVDKKALYFSLQERGWVRIKVGGYSMWPALRNGQEVYLISRSPHWCLGRIAAVFCQNQLIVHRVIWPLFLKSKQVWLMGDQGEVAPAPVIREEIVGWVSCEGSTFKKILFQVGLLGLGGLGYLLRPVLLFLRPSKR